MNEAKLNNKFEKKVKHNKALMPSSKSRLYLEKAQLEQYFKKYKALSEPESLAKKEHKDSNLDLESSSSTNEAESKRTSIAINTEEDSLPYSDHNNYRSLNYMQPHSGHLNDAKYFMYPVNGIQEECMQTQTIQEERKANEVVAVEKIIPVIKSKVCS
jgi:hypothetical protein